MSTPIAGHHNEWLSLIEVSGPFLTLPVLKRALPQGLDPIEPELVDELRRAYDELQADSSLQREWVGWTLASLLGFDEQTLREGPAVPPTLTHTLPEHRQTLVPDLVACEPSDNGKVVPRLLVSVWPLETDLTEKLADESWAASPLDRMTELLRAKGIRLGLVTNGERWTLVQTSAGGPTTYATWEAGIWLEDRPTLAAFVTLLGARRFFGLGANNTLEALFEESMNAEQEVTDQLGRQVRQAVELLVNAFTRANRDHGGALLEAISEREIYLATVTVMMRLVFLLCAEERQLFLLGDPLYDGTYAVSTLRAQLQEDADRYGEDPLDHRAAAWYRLLATFRMVHDGVEHENLRLPGYGGTLFDPDRFPFLEGRKDGETWHENPGRPLPVDDRTVLHMLDALQVLTFRGRRGVTEARRLSFRALDVEQIGHVYEGLLDHEVIQVDAPTLALDGKLEPERALQLLEEKASAGRPALVEWLVEETGRTAHSIEKALDAPLTPHERALLVSVCDTNEELADRIAPFHGLLRHDLRDLPQVYLPGSYCVTKTLERRSSGTYYTPRSLAEEMVTYALEPLVYEPGPAQGPDRASWKLRSPANILELKVCDMAMGSGAFLVAACRFLAERLIEAWSQAGDGAITVDGLPAGGASDELHVPDNPDDRVVLAHRLVADRCLYGVDKNPMAVEMAKLSMWLVTLAKDQVFTFVDHALRCGDSLLGITDLAQIENLHIDPQRGRKLHHSLFDYQSVWAPAVERAVERRRALEAFPVITLRDAQEKERIFHEAEQELEALKVVGDVIIGTAISTASQGDDALDQRLLAVADGVAIALDPERKESDRSARLESLYWDAVEWLNMGRPPMQADRCTFHWPLEFPEVFVRGGFDAIVGNPPFQGGKRISGALGTDYREHLVERIAGGRRGNADLVAYFYLRAAQLIRHGGTIGLLATNSISQGDTREVGLDQLCDAGWTIQRAWKSGAWPGDASLEIAKVWLSRNDWQGSSLLDGQAVSGITSMLDARSRVTGRPHPLVANANCSFIGSALNSEGFILTTKEAEQLLGSDPKNRDVLAPYLIGEDLNSSPTFSPSRWVIDFAELTLDDAKLYPDCLSVLRDRVLPDVEAKETAYPGWLDRWWQLWRPRRELYNAIQGLDRVTAITRVSKTAMPVIVRTGIVYGDRLAVFPYDDYGHLGLLSSAHHWWWVVKYTATLRTDLIYSPTDCFETFPQPQMTEEISRMAEELDEHRRALMLERNEGLTKTYSRVHSADEKARDIQELRRLHVQLDHAVSAAYGWDHLDLDHGFYETPQGLRFTIGQSARVEVLDRLLELNHERYKAEAAAGLHDKKSTKAKQVPQASVHQSVLDGLS